MGMTYVHAAGMEAHAVLARHSHAHDVAFIDSFNKVVGSKEGEDSSDDEGRRALAVSASP